MTGGAASTVPRVVGRERELAVLDAALASARGGAGRLVLLAGPPGIGKSCLAEAFGLRARAADVEVLPGRCYEGSGAPPFWPWTQILRAYAATRDATTMAADFASVGAPVASMLPALRSHLPPVDAASPLGDDETRLRFFDALTRALVRAGAQRPMVIVIDDLQGADRPSLLLLQFLACELPASRLVVIGTVRDVALSPGHPQAALLHALVSAEAGALLTLSGLEPGAIAEVVRAMTGTEPRAALVEALSKRTDGNPLYVTELVRTLLETGRLDSAADESQLPATVRSALASHLSVLTPPTLATLTSAALLGRDFRLAVVARAVMASLPTVRAHVAEAVAAGVLAAHPTDATRHRFVHALFAEALAEGIGEAQRVTLHRRAAAALEADVDDEAMVTEIAYHWFAAGPGGDPVRAVASAQRAADRACAALAFEEAATWYEKALTALGWYPSDDGVIRSELLLALGDAHKAIGTAEKAKEAFASAAALGRTQRSAAILTRAALGHAPVIAWGGQPTTDPTVVALLEEAIASWAGRDSDLHARALAELSAVLIFGDRDRRSALASEAVAMARRLADPATLRFALATWFNSYLERHAVEKRLALASELLELARGSHDLDGLAVGRLWRHVHLLEAGDAAGAAVERAALAATVEERPTPFWRWYVAIQHVVPLILAGHFDAAEHASTRAAALGQKSLPYATSAYFVSQMLVLRLLQGREEYVADYRALFERHPDPATMSPLVWIDCEFGRADDARDLFRRLSADGCAPVKACVHSLVAAVFLTEGCAVLGETDVAAALYDIVLPNARHWAIWAEGVPIGPVAHSLGLLARTLGRLDEADAHFADAVAAARRIGAAPFLARDLYERAVVAERRGGGGDLARARRLLGEAGTLARRLGMEGLTRKLAAIRGGRAHPATIPRRRVEADAAAPTASFAATSPNVFRREGEAWVISFAGTTVRMRNARGLRYLTALLRAPGRELHVSELIDAADRRGVVDPESARVQVTKRIGASLARIAAVHPVLGAHLKSTVRRGYRCAYVPDPRYPIVWDL